jgi:hypothetical protein
MLSYLDIIIFVIILYVITQSLSGIVIKFNIIFVIYSFVIIPFVFRCYYLSFFVVIIVFYVIVAIIKGVTEN